MADEEKYQITYLRTRESYSSKLYFLRRGSIGSLRGSRNTISTEYILIINN